MLNKLNCNGLITLLSTLLISGCTSPYAPDFVAMSSKYVNLLEQYQANMIFTNIIRSSQDRPISFLDIPTISGSGGITQGGNIGGSTGSLVGNQSVFDLAANSLSLGYSFGFSNSFNWSQSSLDNQTFWKNFVTPLPISAAQYARHSNLPRELVATLSIASIQITHPDGREKLLLNSPQRPDYEKFQNQLYKLINLGLGPQLSFTETNIGEPISERDLLTKYGSKPDYNLAKEGLVAVEISNAPEKRYQIQKLTPIYKLCIPQARFSNLVLQEYGPNLYCQESLEIQAALKNSNTLPTLTLTVRSSKEVYEFLGEVAALQLVDEPKIILVPPTKNTFVKNPNAKNAFAILVIEKNNPSGRKLAQYDSLDDNSYSIPMKDNGYSNVVMNLLTQFLTLAKTPGSIPTPPVVLVR